ncbi:MAG: GIY-YIG nuclease family protein [Anaerolineales bacterium]|nr:GIY-YIG nuclease family protein [Anaerolineales bacterium]
MIESRQTLNPSFTEAAHVISDPGELSFPSTKGSYVLVLWLVKPQTVLVGRLGELHFQAGHYLYVGSAFGAGGLGGRLKHHLSPQKLHWHIDYLRSIAQLQEVWFRADEQCRECEWATELAKLPQLSRPYPGFGSSDCRCVSHLFYCPSAEAFATIRSLTPLTLWERCRG